MIVINGAFIWQCIHINALDALKGSTRWSFLFFLSVVSRPVGSASASHPQQHSDLISVVKSPTSLNAVHTAVHAVNEKMLWASQALSSAHSTGECQQLCELLKTCAETLRALREIQQ